MFTDKIELASQPLDQLPYEALLTPPNSARYSQIHDTSFGGDEIMPDLADGESIEMKGSGAKPYVLKNTGGSYHCTCPAWRNQSIPPERRTCKHLRKLRGDDEEEARIGGELPIAIKSKEEKDKDKPELLLAENWNTSTDLAGWWMSEKLDGYRAYWDGSKFISRLGNTFHAPDWFVEGLPEVPLDGELWIDRGAFNKVKSVVGSQSKGDNWKTVRYLVFDAPTQSGGFEDRVGYLKDHFAGRPHPYTACHEHELCRGIDHLQEELERVLGLGGEGLMLREPGSSYESGRSSSLLKVKRFLDAEAVVIGYEPGKGKHKGKTGSLLVELAGVKFNVGTGLKDIERANPPALGSVITFRYQELSEAGVPRFPSYVGVRSDGPSAATITPTSAESVSVGVSPAVRRFEFSEGSSEKFWEVSVSGDAVTTRYGKIGSEGRATTKSYKDSGSARAAADKLIDEKTDKGYTEVE